MLGVGKGEGRGGKRYGGRCREVCWGVGMSKERCVARESVWGEWGSVSV